MIVDYAEKFYGVPYVWGGSNPMSGMDCSGFVQWVLRSIGFEPKTRLNAQAIHDHFSAIAPSRPPQPGDLVFFGLSTKAITHIGIYKNRFQFIESGGGDHTCVNPIAARARGACVRLTHFNHRKDLVAIIPVESPEVT